MAGRFFFHLINRNTMIADSCGVEAENFASAGRAAKEVIAEYRAGCADDESLRDWMLIVTDEIAHFALVLPLGR